MFMQIEWIIKEAAQWKIELSPEQGLLFEKYYRILTYYNQKFNLTRITGKNEILEEHFLDSLAGFSLGLEKAGEELLDLGSGAGFPGLPIKIFLPDLQLHLVDSRRKKILFLRKAVRELELKKITFLQKRAEELGQGEGREKYGWVTARALAPLNVAVELALPLIKIGGYFWAFKGQGFKAELREAEKIIEKCGGRLQKTITYTLPHAKKKRSLLLFKKVQHTDDRFPRKAGLPQKRPVVSQNPSSFPS
ncbi:MAG TPA: 16S rRNA (guanine(527)-N(7))-methyltransferase RsmG [Firmicutes bacterium]|nr:16S rRNA (guanine(527)-N(7))-methyltransferase RsmG [Bacillota bacterium]